MTPSVPSCRGIHCDPFFLRLAQRRDLTKDPIKDLPTQLEPRHAPMSFVSIEKVPQKNRIWSQFFNAKNTLDLGAFVLKNVIGQNWQLNKTGIKNAMPPPADPKQRFLLSRHGYLLGPKY